ncbi:MAG: phage holin family protein [Planctomycetota bacterium]|nr:MAG: phage holin family protein [Planctomycetota bacterium]
MEPSGGASPGLAGIARRMIRHMRITGQNRLELFSVEIEEGRDEVVYLIGLWVGLMGLALLAMMALSASLIIALWPLGPVLILAVLGLLYACLAVLTGVVLRTRWRAWKLFEGSLEQLRRDHAAISGSAV